MKKKVGKIALSFLFTALAFSGTAVSFAKIPHVVHAENNAQMSSQIQPQTTLVSPTSYEQYLNLNKPTDIAFCNDYIAIADGNVIYLYDKKEGVYRKYEHTLNNDAQKNTVTKLQFDANNRLYFLDATFLYILDPRSLKTDTLVVEETGFPCSTFLLEKNILYYIDIKTEAQLSKIELDGSGISVSKAITLVSNLKSKPAIAFWQNELYYTDAGKYLHKIDPETKEDTFITVFPSEIVSMQIVDNVFICSCLDGNFYAYNLVDLTLNNDASKIETLHSAEGAYSSLAPLGDWIYAIEGKSIRQYSVKNSAFTDYEIGNASSSFHRLNGGVENTLADGILYTADNGNDRISVYNTKTETFLTPFACAIDPTSLAVDGETLLAANQTQAIVYNLSQEGYGEILYTSEAFEGTLIGATAVYGSYYLTTDANYYYQIQNTSENWTQTGVKKTTTHAPKLLTSDAYGYLYIASGNSVYQLSETQFLSKIDDGWHEVSDALPDHAKKILVDYDQNFYALADGKVQKLGEEAYDLNTPLVYSPTATISSFAFGIEENQTYILYEENYMAKTTALELSTVKTISVGENDENIFDVTLSATTEVYKTAENGMLVFFDLSALSGAEYFPYLYYDRQSLPLTALKIGETDKHNLLVAWDKEQKKYVACLALKSDCIPQENFSFSYETPTTLYLTNDVSLYKYPHLNDLPAFTRLTRGAQITVIGELNGLDYDYYTVSYQDEQGKTQTGYIPKPFAINFDSSPATQEKVFYGNKQGNTDSMYRLAYLILGAGAVCILSDVLLFRVFHVGENKKKRK